MEGTMSTSDTENRAMKLWGEFYNISNKDIVFKQVPLIVRDDSLKSLAGFLTRLNFRDKDALKMFWDRAKYYGMDTGDNAVQRIWEIMNFLDRYWPRENFSDAAASWVQNQFLADAGNIRDAVTNQLGSRQIRGDEFNKIVWAARDLYEVYLDFFNAINSQVAYAISLRADLYTANFEMPILQRTLRTSGISPLTEQLISAAVGLQEDHKALLLDCIRVSSKLSISLDLSLVDLEITRVDQLLDLRRDPVVRSYRDIFSSIQEVSSERKFPLIVRLQGAKSKLTDQLIETYRAVGICPVSVGPSGAPLATTDVDLNFLSNAVSEKYREILSDEIYGLTVEFTNSIRTEDIRKFKDVLHHLRAIFSVFVTDWLERHSITEITAGGRTELVKNLELGKKLRKTIDVVKSGMTGAQQEALKEVESFLWEAVEIGNRLEHPERLQKVGSGEVLKAMLIVLSTVCVLRQI